MKISYDNDYPMIANNNKNLEVSHNHSQTYDTSYLYNSSLTDGQKATANNTINERTSKLRGCIAFFDSYKHRIIKDSCISAVSASAVAEDQALLNSLTHRNI